MNELVKWGARFHREEDGRLTQRFFGAHTYRRTVFYEDWTGQEIIRVLMNQVQEREIEIIDNVFITRLLKSSDNVNGERPSGKGTESDEIKGALGINIEKKVIVIFECDSLILAPGGYTRVYSVSSSRIFENYGEGVALAYEAGTDLVDMEMVQFHPTGMVWPEKALGTLATEAIRGEGGILLNSEGERFMKRYDPQRMDLGPRDVVARANYNEIINGRGTEQLGEVGPTAHYSMGGVVVDLKCRTKIGGLFAVGEVMSQIHGANRLGGNSLLDTVVFGKIAGNEAPKSIKEEREKSKKENRRTIRVTNRCQ